MAGQFPLATAVVDEATANLRIRTATTASDRPASGKIPTQLSTSATREMVIRAAHNWTCCQK
jgi:hypothetical protein